MWLCLNKGFYSIVHDKLDPTRTRLVVRARRKGDISKLFPDAEIIPDVGTDYKFRAFITRKDVADRFAKEIMEIDYTNFKSSCKNDEELHNAYMKFWHIMFDLQTDATRADRFPEHRRYSTK